MSNSSSNVLYIGNLPWQWDIEVVKSVIKGSGRVVDVRYKSDRKKSFCFIEYLTPEDAARALELLGQVRYGGSGNGKKKLRIELSKEGLKKKNQHSDKPVLQLTREYLPVDVKLPDGILSDEEKIAYKRNDGNANFVSNNGNGSNTNMHSNGAFGAGHEFPMPQHLLQASNNLPPINKTYFNADSKVSQNLEAIAPNQIIQLVANLKNLLINNDFNSAASILKLSPQLTIAVAQALLLMGFVDNDVITQAATAATAASNNNTSFGGNIPGAGTPVPSLAPINNFRPLNNNNNLQPYNINNSSNNNNNNNNNNFNASGGRRNNGISPSPQPQIHQQQQQQQQHIPNIPPHWASLPPSSIGKLLSLDRSQAEVIAQVLLLTPEQLLSLPNEQKFAVEQVRSQYL